MIKLINLNIEGDRHLLRVVDFLKREKADIVCLQELFEENLGMLKNELNMEGKLFPTVNVTSKTEWAKNTKGLMGVGILTKKDLSPRFGEVYYHGERKKVQEYIWRRPNTGARALGWVDLANNNGTSVRIAATHFTWSPDGRATDKQRAEMEKLLRVLDKLKDFVLCGDFNAPRGGIIWRKLAKRYRDNIPLEVKTTIDPDLHRHGALELVVDGLFSTGKYKISGVKVIGGISDHMAVVGMVECENND